MTEVFLINQPCKYNPMQHSIDYTHRQIFKKKLTHFLKPYSFFINIGLAIYHNWQAVNNTHQTVTWLQELSATRLFCWFQIALFLR
ncbi:hypothetical protein METHPM2_40098 [Pseudomonas sp. PM2]